MLKNTLIKPITLEEPPQKIVYGFADTSQYGELFFAYYLEENLYVCYSHFKCNKTLEYFENDLQKLWPKSMLEFDNELTKETVEKLMTKQKQQQEIYVVLNGTDFQRKVWSALLEIPFGEERTYSDLAVAIGNPKAVRAVASAIGSNNIAIFIPCHRVKAKTGDLHKYRWGGDLKKKILLNEKAE